MSLQAIKEKGFTIVELLIVIVVIGVLAAIVIVAYTGITQNANTSQAQSNANAVAKVAEVMNADTGSYPTTVAALTAGSTTSRLPSGVTLVTGAPTSGTHANMVTRANTDLPSSGSAQYTTIAVYRTGTAGGAVFYRMGTGALGGPIYYGAGSATATGWLAL